MSCLLYHPCHAQYIVYAAIAAPRNQSVSIYMHVAISIQVNATLLV
jgi:hypothetical protein